jgi:tetratricopeptide (TPR) repeat protein
MAELYRESGLYEEATGAYYALIARNPDSERSRKAQKQIAELRILHRPDQEQRISLLRALADRQRRKLDRRGAREALERILFLQPRDALALKDLAFLAAKGGDLEEAMRLAQRSLEYSPGNTDALLVKAFVLAKQRKFHQALTLYEGILETAPPPRVKMYAEAMERALEVFADR